ncbi:fat-like cadherin-related tumor suppressor [Caerostris extrusa]|uniref:Fat-like cadherin-related tumor suppressor n=1 Tax=Caerostris extrusa TaxID=172846 RepID=A0AAV4X9K4_CAEEX|nr:fat-like cadherin-related tumor suppressor [Caerostris extrusa]
MHLLNMRNFLECCKSGYGGNRCDVVINECARNPCSSHHVCFPHPSDLGYICQCPPGKTGPLCDRDKTKICQGSTCYEEKNPFPTMERAMLNSIPHDQSL